MYTLIFTNDTVSETWSSSNQSDAWAGQVADGGAKTLVLGQAAGAQTQSTIIGTLASSAVKIHMGTWVTPASPEAVVITDTSTIAANAFHGYQSVNTLNSYVYFKVSIVTEDGGVLSYDRTLTDWTAAQVGGVDLELKNVVASAYPMGGHSQNGPTTHPSMAGTTLAVGERIAVEIGIDKTNTNKTGTVAFEYGSVQDAVDDADLSSGSGTGVFGSSIGIPIGFTEENQEAWADHRFNEIVIPVVSGTNTIAWADVGTDWTTAKWGTTGAQRYVSRAGGVITAQWWVFQDDDYLYIATNNIIDGCIQPSDHHNIFLCAGDDWKNSLITDVDDYCFRRDITASVSNTEAPILPIIDSDGEDEGNYILRGGKTGGYPQQMEVPTWNAGLTRLEFSDSPAENWIEGTDYRMGGPGATSAAPNPNGGGSAGAYSEFKILKSRLNGWDGSSSLGMIVSMQCDVQGNGNTVWPRILGNQVDKSDWNFLGGLYGVGDGQNPSPAAADDDAMDLRPLMGIHGHSPEVVSGSLIEVYNGASWDSKPLKVYNGASWDNANLKVYNGASWDIY